MTNKSFHNVFHLFSRRTFDEKWSGMANYFKFPRIAPKYLLSSALKPFCQITNFDDK